MEHMYLRKLEESKSWIAEMGKGKRGRERRKKGCLWRISASVKWPGRKKRVV
jgi:hypothetical protein